MHLGIIRLVVSTQNFLKNQRFLLYAFHEHFIIDFTKGIIHLVRTQNLKKKKKKKET